jgi:acetyl-CoA acetyltransferase
MFLVKDKPTAKPEQATEVSRAVQNAVEELFLRSIVVERILMEQFGIHEKELQARFLRARKEAILNTFDHEKKEFKPKIDPVVVTNE